MSKVGCREFPRIKVVRAYVSDDKSDNTTSKDQGADCHDVEDTHWINGYPNM
jgi:L-rhamnonate dehydratase